MSWHVQIQSLRLRQGLKQSALAELLGLDQATVSRWERGMSAPSVADQRRIRIKLSHIDGVGDRLEELFSAVVTSPYRVLLTTPGSFKTVAASKPALMHFGLEGHYPDYDWASLRPTEHQLHVYDNVMSDRGIFRSWDVYSVESAVAVRFPDGLIYYNTATYYPVNAGETEPRLVLQVHRKTPYRGEEGKLVIHRSTEVPEALRIPPMAI